MAKKKPRKYAIGGKVTKRDIDKANMKPDDNVDGKIFASNTVPRISNPEFGANNIPGYKKGNKGIKIKKMNRGTSYYTGVNTAKPVNKINRQQLGVDKFWDGMGKAASLGMGALSLGQSMGLGKAKKPVNPTADQDEPKVALEDLQLQTGESLEATGGVVAKKGLNMKKRKYKSKKKK